MRCARGVFALEQLTDAGAVVDDFQDACILAGSVLPYFSVIMTTRRYVFCPRRRFKLYMTRTLAIGGFAAQAG